jgi:tetratricopeptide (TPR) repeat protein
VTEHLVDLSPKTKLQGVIVVQPLLLQYFQLLPEYRPEDEPESSRQYRKALARFKRAVEARYFENTLERLLLAPDAEARQAALLALQLTGSIHVNASVAKRLHDEDLTTRQMAVDALWSIWRRADTPDNNHELRRLMRLMADDGNPEEVLSGFEALVKKAPRFAEAFNQRAVFHYLRGDYTKAIADCEKALRLNPFHFGAAGGMGKCFMKQKKLRAALRIYRRANRINPNLPDIRETIQSLERMLGEEGKR